LFLKEPYSNVRLFFCLKDFQNPLHLLMEGVFWFTGFSKLEF